MNPKYQVFVSSTYVDLKDERDLVIKSVLEMGHIPVGMEMFSAADEEQWGIIKKQIDQSDYYVVIVAHRYGTTDSSGLSYTEKEYDYAASIGVPVLGFIIDDETSWPKSKSDLAEDLVFRLNEFKSKIKLKPISFWKSKDDLYGRCSIALMKAFSAYPREGWVRASLAGNAGIANEVVRLSAENADLRNRVDEYERIESKKNDLDKLIATLKSNKRKLSYFKKNGEDWENGPELTLYQIFESVAPELQVEKETNLLARYFAQILCKVPGKELRVKWPSPRNMISSVLADLSALGCVAPSEKEKPITDTNEYWSLTDFGRELFGHMRRRRLERVERSAIILASNGLSDKKDDFESDLENV
jgi:hypothetical protein